MARDTASSGPTGQTLVDAFGTLPAGARVGRYDIVSVLGRGGFGITYRARDVQLGRDVALKEYLPVHFAERQDNLAVLPRSTQVASDFTWGRERFLAEAKTLAQLGGVRGVVAVHDFLKANGTAYMVMALVRGETLESILRREQTLPFAMLDRFLHPLLDGLERVHATGFLHRDIKPGNVIVDEQGQGTLIDFGAARITLHDRTQSMTVIFTPGYAPFEQTSASGQGPWTDIYALGATLYHGVTGAPPPNAIERMLGDRMVAARTVGAGRYPPAFLAAIDAALALKPEQRPQNIAAWRRVLAGEAVPGATAGGPSWQVVGPVPQPAVAVPPAPAPAGRNGRGLAWATAGAVAVALLGGGGYWAWSTGASRTPPSQTTSAPPPAAPTPQPPPQQATAASPETVALQNQCANAGRRFASAIVVQACTQLIQAGGEPSTVARAYSGRGAAYVVMGDQVAAVRDFDAAIKLDGRNARFYQNRADVYGKSGQNERAIADYNQAIAVDARDAAAYVGRGDVHLRMGNETQALRDYEQAVKLDPANAAAAYKQGLIFANRKDFSQAIRAYTQAIQSAPSEFDYYAKRAVAYEASGDLARAVADYDMAINVRPRDSAALYQRSLLKRRLGDAAGADADLKRAKAIDPNL
ncbi:tetratricopeptide repeat protein [Reyranella sp. CPCC 100927]|uniref:serine/threonine-protein kinase n=1 Tax=Reyranella sp. CPCC 100927 TaxID=2599616 RepID=UPI0011B661CC|nr:serine/threonine-protein kinase [Reyranella sp. CPCC 100927]TWT15117.1 tetratricopeptide repeat protein [Reyranella sp. CPCC 100927]